MSNLIVVINIALDATIVVALGVLMLGAARFAGSPQTVDATPVHHRERPRRTASRPALARRLAPGRG
jgi:hypothetical protein